MWFIYKKRGLIDGIKTMDTDQWCSSTNQCFFQHAEVMKVITMVKAVV